MAGERILVCDDGKEGRDFIVNYILEPNNYQPLIARNGLEALEIVREDPPDLILLDLQMPKMNGMEVLDALKEEGYEIPVVLMTFHGSEEIAIEVYRRGVQDYVKKPFTVDEMQWAIERTLGSMRLRQEKEALTERLIAANSEMNQRIRELNTLYAIGKSVTSLAGLEVLLPRILEAAIEITRAEAGNLYLLQGEELVCRAVKKSDDSQITHLQAPANDPFARRAIQMGKPLALGPEEMQSHRRDNAQLPIAILVTPLIVGKRVIGALSVSNASAEAGGFRKQDGAMLSALSDYAAIAIENAANYTELAHLKEREVAKIYERLKAFMPVDVLEAVLSDTDLSFESYQTDVGVVLVELKGHQSLVGRTDPAQLTAAINGYLDLAVNIIADYGGTAERYLSDGLIAYFNVPQARDSFIMDAIEAAVAVLQSVGEQGQNIGFGIALHLGRAVAGNIGVLRGLSYSVVGPFMKELQRLQENVHAGQILVTEDFISRADQDRVQATYLGQISAHSRQQRINVYEITGLS
ncbi:MAG: response regulator [Chloroflexi bacterium]|nr:response regulator [Chloroflexota bacterium]